MEERDPMLKQVRAKVNDKEHEVLYKSPGSNPGGPGSKGRTWDFVQATTKEQSAQLIADGWSVSQEEAFELADALKAGKKGAKKLVRRKEADEADEEEAEEEPDEVEADEDSEEDPILAAPKKAPKTKKKAKR